MTCRLLVIYPEFNSETRGQRETEQGKREWEEREWEERVRGAKRVDCRLYGRCNEEFKTMLWNESNGVPRRTKREASWEGFYRRGSGLFGFMFVL
jgi:hypothetical protein